MSDDDESSEGLKLTGGCVNISCFVSTFGKITVILALASLNPKANTVGAVGFQSDEVLGSNVNFFFKILMKSGEFSF